MSAAPRRRSTLRRLAASGLFAPGSLLAFLATSLKEGPNLGSLARVAAKRFGSASAIVEDGRRLSFTQLAADSDRMAAALRDTHHVRPGAAVGLLGRNGIDLVRALFAASRIGARVLLLNAEMSERQLVELAQRHGLDLLLTTMTPFATLRPDCPVVDIATLLATAPQRHARLPRVSGGELVVLTGGTTGPPKAAARRPAPANFLRLLLHLIGALELDRYPSVYVAVPLFHGYGLAALIIATVLGRTVHLSPKFDTAAACAAIARDRIAALVVVPAMLQRMLAAPADLSRVRCVISGGAALPAHLAVATRQLLGDVLFNLYGTSEGGVAILASPADLARAPDTIGRELWGVRARILGRDDAPVPPGQVGRLCISGSASIAPGAWIETGDLAMRDRDGRLFLRGRADDMIVSGGENVSPWEVETVLMEHPLVAEAAAVGVPDPHFGQRLAAFVVLQPQAELTAETLSRWLAERVARYQRPRSIEIRSELPRTAIGKVDKQALAR